MHPLYTSLKFIIIYWATYYGVSYIPLVVVSVVEVVVVVVVVEVVLECTTRKNKYLRVETYTISNIMFL